jgi:hypothetical protein
MNQKEANLRKPYHLFVSEIHTKQLIKIKFFHDSILYKGENYSRTSRLCPETKLYSHEFHMSLHVYLRNIFNPKN